jgi:hypothetical protein
MIELFYPPKIYPRPTRTVMLSGEPEPGTVRPYKPPKIAKPVVDPKRARKRAMQAEWVRNKRRSDPAWREEVARRERERYWRLNQEQRAAILERNKVYKQEMRGNDDGD